MRSSTGRAGRAANISAFRDLVGHLEASALGARALANQGSLAMVANRYLATRQVGFLMSYLGTRVLGQYDIALLSAEEAPGRLLFVEENIRATARALGVPLDRLPDLDRAPRGDPCVRDGGPSVAPARTSGSGSSGRWTRSWGRRGRSQAKGLRHLVERWRAAAAEGSITGFMSPEQRGLMRETQLVMSLMEGFCDWVMDDVGEQLLPDVAGIRRALRGSAATSDAGASTGSSPA